MPGVDRIQARLGFNTYVNDGAAPRADVVLDLLGELRASAYTPSAWVRFVARSWRIASETADTHPHLVRSWRRVAASLTLAELAALLAEALTGGEEGLSAARRAAPGAALCLAYTLGDAFAHLGMNHDAAEAPLYDTLGLPTILTLVRSAAAGLLFGHLLGGAPASRPVLCVALAMGGLTDIADGQIARKTQRATRLGAYLDSEADVGVALAMTLTLLARRALPGWLVTAMLARWLAPFAYALASYFGQGRRVPIGSTVLGKAAGVAQTLTLSMALLPEHIQKRTSGPRHALHVTLAALLVAAPLVQLAQARGAARDSCAHQAGTTRGRMRRRGQ